MVAELANNTTSQQLKANEIFLRMVANDETQNKRLSATSGDHEQKAAAAATNGLGGQRSSKGGGQTSGTKMRFLVCTLGLFSLAMSQMSRMVLNLSITQMIDPSMLAARAADDQQQQHQQQAGPGSKVTADGSCPWPEEEDTSPLEIQADGDSTMQEVPDYEVLWPGNATEPATPAATATTTVLPTYIQGGTPPVASEPSQPGQERFNWTMRQQNTLLGGFYYSYSVFMVLGGRMSETYGAKYVLLLGVAGSALINLLTPLLARTSFLLLVMSRVLMGAIQAGVFPGMYALIAKWLTMSEASIFAPLIKMNLRLGMVMGSLIPGLVSGWPQVFYWTGALSFVWSILWVLLASSQPQDNRWVSAAELSHIMRKKRKRPQQAQPQEFEEVELQPTGGQQQVASAAADGRAGAGAERGPKPKPKPKQEAKQGGQSTPWLRILTAPSVVGLIIVKLTFNYAIDFLAIELPSYLKYVHHASKQKISAITTPMFSIQVFLIVFVGWLAKVMVQRRPLGLSKTAIRKLFQGLASFGLALGMLLITFNDCNLLYVAALLQLVSFLSMFTAGGETMLPYDLSDEYPATIMAIANSIANVSAVTTTTLAGLILGDQGGSYHRWNILIYLIVGANLIGGAAFLLLVSAEPIDFAKKRARGPCQGVAGADVELGSGPTAAAAGAEVEAKKSRGGDVSSPAGRRKSLGSAERAKDN